MILQSGNNRLLIYFFYDKAGIVDDYIVYMLNKLSGDTVLWKENHRNAYGLLLTANGLPNGNGYNSTYLSLQ